MKSLFFDCCAGSRHRSIFIVRSPPRFGSRLTASTAASTSRSVIGAAALKRVLREHTYVQRALEVETALCAMGL